MTERNDGARAGLALVESHEIRVVEWAPRRADDVMRIDLTAAVGEAHDLRGPAVSHPRGRGETAPGAHSSQQQDLHAKRLERHVVGAIRREARGIAQAAAERGWWTVLVYGDPRLTHPAAEVLRHEGVKAVEHDRILGWMASHELADAVAADAEQALGEVAAAHAHW